MPATRTGTLAAFKASATFHASAPPVRIALSFSSSASFSASRISSRRLAWRMTGRSPLAYDKVRAEARAHQAVPPEPDPRLAALAPYAKASQ